MVTLFISLLVNLRVPDKTYSEVVKPPIDSDNSNVISPSVALLLNKTLSVVVPIFLKSETKEIPNILFLSSPLPVILNDDLNIFPSP